MVGALWKSFILGALVVTCIAAQIPSAPQNSSSCRQFANEFYAWYVPLTQKTGNGRPWDLALHRKAEMSSPALFQALNLDSEAAARAKGEIVGIDFDPFVGSQDPYDHYEARHVTWVGNRCSVDI
jgi:hypothetical protein